MVSYVSSTINALPVNNKYTMRKYINIIESAGFHVPDFSVFVTDELVDRILTSNQWIEHGSHLDDSWIGDMAAAQKSFFPFEVDTTRDDSLKQLKADPAFLPWFKNYLLLRAQYIRDSFLGVHGFGALTGDTRIYRAMMVSKAWLNEVKQPSKGMLPLGIYWGIGEVHPWGYDGPHGNEKTVVPIKTPHEVMLSTTLKDVIINWEQTFYSRLDYDNGDQEQEIQLEKGSIINNVMIEENDKGRIVPNPNRQFIA